MKFYTNPSIFFPSLILLFPLSTKAQVPPQEITQPVTEEEVRQFIGEYTARFMKLDLDAFMELFSKEAIENRMLPYADIREAYRRTVSISQSISYQVKIYSIQPSTRGAFVSGRYEIVQILKGRGKRVFKSNVQWNLIREKGSLKVLEINYGNH